MGIEDTQKLSEQISMFFFQMTVHVYSLLGQTEKGKKVVFLKEDWGRRRVHGETSKRN